MTQHPDLETHRFRRITANSAILLSFIVALEIVIMISPFALFFYAVFNPFLLALNQSPLTRWLTAFFLPHMIVPPTDALKLVRILGSVFFVVGLVVFIVCALQVYFGKLLKKGTATSGLYRIIRHPQYVGLALAAVGLAIMWPRFLTLVLLAIMIFLYYLLARDEEQRMCSRFGQDYREYMTRTGMFVPKFTKLFSRTYKENQPPNMWKTLVILLLLLVFLVGGGFSLRTYTVHHLPMEEINGIDALTILPSDTGMVGELLPDVLSDSTIASTLNHHRGGPHVRILAYFMPVDYVMQGMIANTGGEWQLYEQHKTIGMIVDYIIHPFAHLTGGHAQHMAMQSHDPSKHNSPSMRRRIIFVEVSSDQDVLNSPRDDFRINIKRVPLCFADIHIHTHEIVQVRDTPSGSGWGSVPTPMF
jgi:protein-S-isoprenylcysteine O-methyltransferase Ste14